MMRAMIVADPFLLMWLTLALAGLAIIAYTHPRIPLELTSVVLVAALPCAFFLSPWPVPFLSRAKNGKSPRVFSGVPVAVIFCRFLRVCLFLGGETCVVALPVVNFPPFGCSGFLCGCRLVKNPAR